IDEKEDWTLLAAPSYSSVYPSRRDSSMLQVLNDTAIIYGGSNSHTTFSDTWMFDLNQQEWSKVNITSPGARLDHVSVARKQTQEIFIFGGTIYNASTIKSLESYIQVNDVWSFSLNTLVWTKVIYTSSNKVPMTRSNSIAVITADESAMVIFGGVTLPLNATIYTMPIVLNDLWQFNLSTLLWNPIEPVSTSSIPPSRFSHAASTITREYAIMNPSTYLSLVDNIEYLMIFSGLHALNNGFTVLDDAWMFPLNSAVEQVWTRLTCTPSLERVFSSAVTIQNKLWFFGGVDYSSDSSTNVYGDTILGQADGHSSINYFAQDPTTASPLPRFGHRMAVWKDQILLFGGQDDKFFGDLWLRNTSNLPSGSLTSLNAPISFDLSILLLVAFGCFLTVCICLIIIIYVRFHQRTNVSDDGGRSAVRPRGLSTDEIAQIQLIIRWDHNQFKWRVLNPLTTTIYDTQVTDVVFGHGTIGIELAVVKDQVVIKTYAGSRAVQVLSGTDLRKGLVVDAINEIDVDRMHASDVIKMLQTTPRPMKVRFTTSETSSVVCRLCECLVEVSQLEEHTEFCVFSCKHEQQAEELNTQLRRVATSITSNMKSETIRPYFTEIDTQFYKTMKSIALQAAACDIASIQSFDVCVHLLKALEHANCDSLSSSCVVERGIKYATRIQQLIHAKMNHMRLTQKLLLTRETPLGAQAAVYRTKSLENNTAETSRPSAILISNNRPPRISIQDFDIIKPISKGAFGRVYLAKKKTTGDQFAIKVLAKEHVLRKKQLGHIETERNVLANVESPFVVKLFWTFQSKHNLFLVMEYLPGGDFMSLLECIVRLEENLTDFGLSEEAVTWDEEDGDKQHEDVLNDLNDAFFGQPGYESGPTTFSTDELSEQTDIHEEFLGAFQPSPTKSKTPLSYHRCGTPDYLSPEIILGEKHGTPVDYWALGVIIYEMLVGFPPFNDDTVEAIFSNILAGRIIWPNQDQRLSPSAEDLIIRLLEMDPNKRMGWSELTVHPFFAEHGINWDTLLDTSPPFVPTLDDPYDTSYFNNRDLTEDFVEEDEAVLELTSHAISIPAHLPPLHVSDDGRMHYGYGSPLLTPTTPEAFRTFSFTNTSALAAAGREEAIEKFHDDMAQLVHFLYNIIYIILQVVKSTLCQKVNLIKMDDHHFMRLAIAQAHLSPRVESAFCVGCVIVKDGKVISTGYSRELPGNTHAEQCALIKINMQAQGTDLYTTMEPCSIRLSGNKTCVVNCIEAGVSRVIVGAMEPSTFVECKGVQILGEHGIQHKLLNCCCIKRIEMDEVNQENEGVIHAHVQFAEAAANGSKTMVEFLLDNGADIDAPGRDGTTPLCAAALWGNEVMVKFLLSRGARVSARNDGTSWTALHAAAFQEHGKVVRILLDAGADPYARDAEGRTPTDYASISEAIWPFFAARGCEKSIKSDLVGKGIIRKVQDQPEFGNDNIPEFSRPGSSYQRTQFNPLISSKPKSRDGRSFVDPLSQSKVPPSTARRPSLSGLAL
ncbi:kinase, partial [Thraustotheca clavata]